MTNTNAQPLVNSPFPYGMHTMGWKLFEYWPSAILTNASVSIVQAIRVKCQDANTKERTKVVETVWSETNAENGYEKNIDWNMIGRLFLNKSADGEEVVEFIIKVQYIIPL